MAVSPVRRSLKFGRLGPAWRAPTPPEARSASGAVERTEALAWVRGRLAWEHRLGALRAKATATDANRVNERGSQIPLAE